MPLTSTVSKNINLLQFIITEWNYELPTYVYGYDINKISNSKMQWSDFIGSHGGRSCLTK